MDASDQILEGRAKNFLEPKHVQQIHVWYQAFEDVENYVKVATPENMLEKYYDLNIPLYVDTLLKITCRAHKKP